MITKAYLITTTNTQGIQSRHLVPDIKFGPGTDSYSKPELFFFSFRAPGCRKSQILNHLEKSQNALGLKGIQAAKTAISHLGTLQNETVAAKSYTQNATGEPKFPSGILVRLVGFRDKQSVLRRKNDGGLAFFPTLLHVS